MSWEKVKLEEAIKKPISGEWGEEGNSVYVLRTTNFSNDGSLYLDDVVKRNIPQDKIEKKKLKYGDTILEKSGGSPSQPVGRVVYFDIEKKNGTPYLCNNFTSVIRPKDNFNSKYLFWFLFYNHIAKKTLGYQNKTTGIINLQTDRYIKELEIPNPPLLTQQKIAAILDKADELRKKDLQLLAKYEELLQSIFYDMFGDPVKNEKGWKKKKIGEVLDVETGSTPSRNSPDYYKGNIPWIKTGEVIGEEIISSEEKISEEAIKNSNCKILPINTILLAMYGQGLTRGRVGLLKLRATTNQACAAILPSENISPLFTFYLLKSLYFQIRDLGRGGNQPNLNLSIVRDIELIIPPPYIQKKFGLIAQNIQNQKQQIKRQITKSEDIFQNLLQRVFKGELIK
ncbi:MAG: restriction endonuclease subunit S [Ferruginibacter sp.]